MARFQVLIVSEAFRTDLELVKEIPLLIGSQPLLIKGLVIEDEQVLRATALPIVKEISYAGEVRRLTPEQLRLDFLEVAQKLQTALGQLTAQLGYSSSFEVVKGAHAAELVRAAEKVDFVVIARPNLPGSMRPRRGVSLQPLVAQDKSLLVVNEPWLSGHSVVVVYEGEQSANALNLGARYARSAELDLIVAATKGASRADTQEQIGARWVEIDSDEESLASLCHKSDARLLVLSRSDTPQLTSMLPKLIDRVPCSILRLA